MDKLSVIKKIIKSINLDYYYYHIFDNKLLNLDYKNNAYNSNIIFYLLVSSYKTFLSYYDKINEISITDLFLERLDYSKEEYCNLFWLKFINLFWLRLNFVNVNKTLYKNLVDFILLNIEDLNRVFLEDCSLDEDFIIELNNTNGFNKNIISFINLNNNNLKEKWFDLLIDFILNNHIKLEYLSLVSNNINFSENLDKIYKLDKLRILDLTWNFFDKKGETIILNYIKNSKSIKELYLWNIEFSDDFFDDLIIILKEETTRLNTIKVSIKENKKIYKEKLENKKVYIDFVDFSKDEIYSTIYIKYFNEEEIKDFKKLESNYFYLTDSTEKSYSKILKSKKYLQYWINLFLFDINDYAFIDEIISKYSFNYIYLENYSISDQDFFRFIEIIRQNKNKTYKINLISIEINYKQLDYLIDNFPKNIFYIEINLNNIVNNREKYILKMLKNNAFIFEKYDLLKKVIWI